jgi:hypothetical protein
MNRPESSRFVESCLHVERLARFGVSAAWGVALFIAAWVIGAVFVFTQLMRRR